LQVLLEKLKGRGIALRMHFHVAVEQVTDVTSDSTAFGRFLREIAISDTLNAPDDDEVLGKHVASQIVAFT
jgi:hypothetical protein